MKGLLRRKIQSSYISLAYIGKLAREKILDQWKNNQQQNKSKGKHYTRICKGNYSFSLKAPKDKYPKRLQLAFYQLKLGKTSLSLSLEQQGRIKKVDALETIQLYKLLSTCYQNIGYIRKRERKCRDNYALLYRQRSFFA